MFRRHKHKKGEAAAAGKAASTISTAPPAPPSHHHHSSKQQQHLSSSATVKTSVNSAQLTPAAVESPSASLPPPPPSSRGSASVSSAPTPVRSAPPVPPSPPSVAPPLSIPAPIPGKAPAPTIASPIVDENGDGARPSEILMEACRRNNVDLLQEVLGISNGSNPRLGAAELINNSRDALGNTALHVAASNGSYECLDILLDVEGVEVDPVNRMEGNTPLHCAAIYAEEEPEHAVAIVDMLIDAGADPRVRNKLKDKPIDLVSKSNTALRQAFQGAEMALMMGAVGVSDEQGDVVEDSGSESE
ncbi:ankyrin repeat-containing domain protein [Lipomyces oligophaga]|uniref:ankyrin repeat-containing domain protein n=1 Tax=Lipomyces oligophaga TaxID=45792 RepID=UPI0034CFA64F